MPGRRGTAGPVPWVDMPPSAVRPTTADSSTTHATAWARAAGRRGRSHVNRSTSDATPVPAASTDPGSVEAISRSAIRRVSGDQHPFQVGDQRVDRLPVVAAAHQPGQPRTRQPGEGQPGPALGDRCGAPDVERVGGQPGGLPVRAGAHREQVAGHRDLQAQRGCALVHVQQPGGGLELSNAEPSGAQRRRRCAAPVLEQQLDMAHQLEGRPGGGAVDQGRIALGGHERRLGVGAGTGGASVAQAESDLAGHGTCRLSRATSSPRDSICSTAPPAGPRDVDRSVDSTEPSLPSRSR